MPPRPFRSSTPASSASKQLLDPDLEQIALRAALANGTTSRGSREHDVRTLWDLKSRGSQIDASSVVQDVHVVEHEGEGQCL
jgi:hypothetical protein